ncbi:MAG: TasA family protein [Gaiellales bacterium]
MSSSNPLGGVSRKLLLSVAAIGAAAAIAGLGTYATFTSSTSASQAVASGTVTVALGATGASTNRLTVGASNIAAGDTIQRSVDLINQGSLNLASVTLTTTATTSSLLNTDTSNGLQMAIDKCSAAWTEAGTAPAYTYTCSGTTTTVLASVPVIGANLALSNLSALTAGATDHLRVTLTLPSTAGNSLQNQSSVIQYSLTGIQRAGTNQ